MPKRCSILQSKLDELESILHDALIHHDKEDKHKELSEEIKQRFVFIKSLLSAEISSSPPAPTKPHHLLHVSNRIHVLEDAFLKWHSSKEDMSQDFDVASSCSCTESCFNDDVVEGGDEVSVVEFVEPEEDFPVGSNAVVEWKEAEECPEVCNGKNEAMMKWEGDEEKQAQKLGSMLGFEDARDQFLEVEGVDEGGLVIIKGLGKKDVSSKNIEVTREKGPITRRNSECTRRNSECGRLCCAMACGFLFGTVFSGFMILNLFGCIHFVEQSCSLVPT